MARKTSLIRSNENHETIYDSIRYHTNIYADMKISNLLPL